jgi:membrane protein required for colicin V production
MDFSTITAFDAVGIFIIGFSGLIGLKRGFSTEVLTFLAWAAAIFFTLFALAWGAQEYGREIISPNALADVITSVALFIAGLVLFRWLASSFGDMVKTSPIGPLDRALGTAFGLLRGALVIAATYLLISTLVAEDDQPNWIKEAQLKPLASYGAEMLRIIVPNLVKNTGSGDAIDKIKDALPDQDTVSDTLTDAVKQSSEETMIEKLENMLDSANTDDNTTTDEEN